MWFPPYSSFRSKSTSIPAPKNFLLEKSLVCHFYLSFIFGYLKVNVSYVHQLLFHLCV